MKEKFVKLARYVWKHLFGFLVLIAISWLAFFSNYSYWETHKLNQEVKDLKAQIKQYNESVENAKKEIEARNGDADKMEHFAREKMGMKRPDEDVFIVNQ